MKDLVVGNSRIHFREKEAGKMLQNVAAYVEMVKNQQSSRT